MIMMKLKSVVYYEYSPYHLGDNNNNVITTIDHLQRCLGENVKVEVNVAFHTRALLQKKPHLHHHHDHHAQHHDHHHVIK